MKLEINKNRITEAVSKSEKITGKNSSLPVLSCVVLEAKGDFLYINSTNLDISLEIKVPAKVQEEGILAVSGNVLGTYLSSLGKSENNLIFFSKDNNLYISSKNSETVIMTVNHEDFPIISKIEGKEEYKIKTNDFTEGLKSVWYSASVSNIKPELSSVYVYPEGEELFFVATDSFRLAEKKIKTNNTENFKPILIPFRNTSEIIRIIEDIEDYIELIFSEDQLIIKTENIYIVSRIVDGVFPDYKQIIPKESSTTAVFLKEDFIQSMRISNIFSNSFNQAQMTISPIDNVFEISTKNKDMGETINKIKANAEGDSLKISFNFKYINDCLSSIKSDTLKFIFNGPGKPLIITGSKDGTFRYLVMPMNK